MLCFKIQVEIEIKSKKHQNLENLLTQFLNKNRQSRSLCIAHKRKKEKYERKKKIILVITNSRCHCVDLIFWGFGIPNFRFFWKVLISGFWEFPTSGFEIRFPVLKSGFTKARFNSLLQSWSPKGLVYAFPF